jgi:hypothetical protein
MALRVTLDRAAGTFRMEDGAWSLTDALARLPHWQALYRGLWSRGSKVKGAPGPWARFYEGSVAALDAAARELDHG